MVYEVKSHLPPEDAPQHPHELSIRAYAEFPIPDRDGAVFRSLYHIDNGINQTTVIAIDQAALTGDTSIRNGATVSSLLAVLEDHLQGLAGNPRLVAPTADDAARVKLLSLVSAALVVAKSLDKVPPPAPEAPVPELPTVTEVATESTPADDHAADGDTEPDGEELNPDSDAHEDTSSSAS